MIVSAESQLMPAEEARRAAEARVLALEETTSIYTGTW
jgi:hypothetical protein